MDTKPRFVPPVVLAIPLLLLFTWATTPLIPGKGGLDTDGLFYATIAQWKTHPFAPTAFRAPWCWRICTPFLASWLPFDPLDDFKALALVSNALSLFLCYALLRRLGRSPNIALLGVFLYWGVFWTVKFSFYSPAYIDFQMQMFLLAVLYLMVARIYWLIPLLLLLAVTQKESLLLLAPIVYVHRARQEGWFRAKILGYFALLLLLPAGMLWWIHSLIPPSNPYSPTDTYLRFLSEQVTTLRFWPRFVLETFSGLGILPLIVLYWRKDAGDFLRKHPEWALQLLLGAILLFGGRDKARLFLYMLPAMVVTVTFVMEAPLKGMTFRARLWLGITLLLHFYLGHHLTPMGTIEQYRERMTPLDSYAPLWPAMLHLLSILAVWLLSTLLLMRPFRSDKQGSQVPLK